MATECPECGKWFRSEKCSCGYRPVKESFRSASSNCSYPGCSIHGSICSSTHPNENTQWFCRYHFGYKPGMTPTPEQMMSNDEKKPRFNDIDKQAITSSIPRGPKKWAYDILALHEKGMYPDLNGVESAKKALAMEEIDD